MVDLCRVRLVADSLSHIIAAVAAVARDGGVRVVRAKNTMRVARATDFAAGFRVRACVRATRALDSDTHIR